MCRKYATMKRFGKGSYDNLARGEFRFRKCDKVRVNNGEFV